MGEIEAALPHAPWQIVLLEKLTKYFEIFQWCANISVAVKI